ncbi:hypothetical protein Tco_1042649 [Tanacetum coccineum]|uniref:Uncharacterized protein n=1 Tax=Tanacetum coccineum TaxID=301880 RepID=A0ABQ5GKE4_9ASTR
MSEVWVIVQIYTRLGFDGDRRILEVNLLIFFMDAKFIIASQTCTLTKDELSQLVVDYDIPQDVWVLLPGYAGIPKALTKPVTYIEGWKGSFFFIKNKIVPSKYPDLLLEENKLGKKSFKDVVPLHVQEDPLYNQIATYPCNVRTFPNLSKPNPFSFRAKIFLGAQSSKTYYQPLWKGSFMVGGIDGEFHFEPEGGFAYGEEKSPSNRSVNNEALVIDIAPLNSAPPSYVAENVRDSNEVSSGGDIIGEAERLRKSLKVTSKRKHATGPSVKEARHKLRKAPPQASKVFDDASDPLDVDSDLDIHGKFYTFSAFFILSTCGSKLIFVFPKFPSAKELKDSANCHFVVAYVVLDNMLNSRTRQLMYALEKARASYDAIREREIEKDKAYIELERNLMKLCRIWKKIHLCAAFEEVASLKEPFILEKMLGYRSSLKEEFDRAIDGLANLLILS